MDVVRSEDGTVYNRIQRQHDEFPTLPPRRSILPVLCIQRRDADADSTSAGATTQTSPTLKPHGSQGIEPIGTNTQTPH